MPAPTKIGHWEGPLHRRCPNSPAGSEWQTKKRSKVVRPVHTLVSRHRRLLLASLSGSERRGKLHPERPASCRRSVVSSGRRLLLASLTGSERRGKLHPERPASCRRSVVSGDRHLLLASLTGSERRGKLHPERPASCRRSVVSGDRRLLLASLTGSERRGKLHPERPASCRRSVVSGDRRLLLASLTGSERRGKLHPERPASCRRSDPMMLLSQPAPDGEDSSIRLASSSTTHSTTRPVLHGRKRCQCNRCVVVGVVEYVLCAMPTTAC